MDRSPPELWFRASPLASLPTLINLIKRGKLIVTPRLGVRNKLHEHGYVKGEIATLRVKDGSMDVLEPLRVRIASVVSKRLYDFTVRDLAPTLIYSSWEAVRKDLSHFAGYHVDAEEMASLVTFEYLTGTEGGDHGALETASA